MSERPWCRHATRRHHGPSRPRHPPEPASAPRSHLRCRAGPLPGNRRTRRERQPHNMVGHVLGSAAGPRPVRCGTHLSAQAGARNRQEGPRASARRGVPRVRRSCAGPGRGLHPAFRLLDRRGRRGRHGDGPRPGRRGRGRAGNRQDGSCLSRPAGNATTRTSALRAPADCGGYRILAHAVGSGAAQGPYLRGRRRGGSSPHGWPTSWPATSRPRVTRTTGASPDACCPWSSPPGTRRHVHRRSRSGHDELPLASQHQGVAVSRAERCVPYDHRGHPAPALRALHQRNRGTRPGRRVSWPAVPCTFRP